MNNSGSNNDALAVTKNVRLAAQLILPLPSAIIKAILKLTLPSSYSDGYRDFTL
jgi:hypothetical protein